MIKKKMMFFLWMVTISIIFIVTIINHKPYFIMGGSTSVSPLMQSLLMQYPQNHKKSDFTYNSLGSDAAILPVTNGMFGIGWLSKEYTNTNNNLISFVLSKDGMILVYNLPQDYLGIDNKIPLNFTKEVVQTMYKNDGLVLWKDLFKKPQNNQKVAQYNWVKPTCLLRVLPYTRENGSGTRDVFNEKVLGDKNAYYPQAVTVNSSTQMFSMAPGGIGYSSYSDQKQLINNPVFKDVAIADWDGIKPSLDAIKTGAYSLARPFTGLINKNYSQLNTLISFLEFLFIKSPDNDKYVVPTLENYAQAPILLDDPSGVNAELTKFLHDKE